MILVIDNYDSFTYNLVSMLQDAVGYPLVCVRRNDQITLAEIESMSPQAIVLSPGPGRPDQAGVTLYTINRFLATIPLLGVCLGHQSLAQACGARIVGAGRLRHGKTSSITHTADALFRAVPSPFTAMRYHSLAIDRVTLPPCFRIIAQSDDQEIMAVRHAHSCAFGLQFHPESFLTEFGRRIIDNFLGIASSWRRRSRAPLSTVKHRGVQHVPTEEAGVCDGVSSEPLGS